MKNAILISDDDLAQLRRGQSLELEVGDTTLTLMYIRTNRTPARMASLVKAQRAVKRLWRTPEGRKKMLRAAQKGAQTRKKNAEQNGA